MLFKYRALNIEGKYISDYIWAKEEKAAIAQLYTLHIDLIKIRRVIRVGRFLTLTELIDFLLYLNWMLRAGVPLRETLEELSISLETAKLSHVAQHLIRHIDQGLFLSEAMALLPKVFTPLSIYYVIVGEKSGCLVQQLTLLIAVLKEEAKWRSKIFTVLAYPLLTLSLALCAFFYLIVEIVPTLVGLLPPVQVETTLGGSIVVSRWLQTYGLNALFFVCVFIAISFIGVNLFPAWRTKCHAYMLRLPLLGPLIRDALLARILEIIAHLHLAGFTLLDALFTVHDLMPNENMRRQFADVIYSMEQGNTLTESFSQKSIFPPILIRALYLAEQSGQVTVALEHAAQFFRGQVLSRMKKVQTLLGPCCLLIVGGILLSIVLLIFAPLFDVVGQVY